MSAATPSASLPVPLLRTRRGCGLRSTGSIRASFTNALRRSISPPPAMCSCAVASWRSTANSRHPGSLEVRLDRNQPNEPQPGHGDRDACERHRDARTGEIGKAQVSPGRLCPLRYDDVAHRAGEQEIAGEGRKQSEAGERSLREMRDELDDEDHCRDIADRVR